VSDLAQPKDWTFTFLDAVSKKELAVLPLTGVKYTKQVSGAGRCDAYINLADDRIRALKPWGATRQRRVELMVEYGDRCVWGGLVISRTRSASSAGMAVTAITYEAWLARQRLLTDLSVATNTRDCLTQLVARAQTVTGVGLTVDQSPGPGAARNWNWLAADVKPVSDLIGNLASSTSLGLEWRIDCFRNADGTFSRVLRWGEPRIGATFDQSQLTFAYPDGGLTDWTLPEDGSAANNVMPWLGSGSGPTQPFGVLYDSAAGFDELASGFPSWMVDFRGADSADPDYVTARAISAMRAGRASEFLLTGVAVHGPAYLASGATPGDDVALDVIHTSMEEWPAEVRFLTRILGESVTVGDGGVGDKVALTVGSST
jgi:hypothetical protein